VNKDELKCGNLNILVLRLFITLLHNSTQQLLASMCKITTMHC